MMLSLPKAIRDYLEWFRPYAGQFHILAFNGKEGDLCHGIRHKTVANTNSVAPDDNCCCPATFRAYVEGHGLIPNHDVNGLMLMDQFQEFGSRRLMTAFFAAMDEKQTRNDGTERWQIRATMLEILQLQGV
jgi:hypothetical protein